MRYLIILFIATIISSLSDINAQSEVYYDFDYPFYGIKGNVEAVTDTVLEKRYDGSLHTKQIIYCRFSNKGLLTSRAVYTPNGGLLQQTVNTLDQSGHIIASVYTDYLSGGRTATTTWKLASTIGNRQEWSVTDKNGKMCTNIIEYSGATKTTRSRKNGIDEMIISSFDERTRVKEVKELQNNLIHKWYAMTVDANGFPAMLKIFYENTDKTSKTTTFNYVKDYQNNWIEQYAYSNNVLTSVVKRGITYRY